MLNSINQNSIPARMVSAIQTNLTNIRDVTLFVRQPAVTHPRCNYTAFGFLAFQEHILITELGDSLIGAT